MKSSKKKVTHISRITSSRKPSIATQRLLNILEGELYQITKLLSIMPIEPTLILNSKTTASLSKMLNKVSSLTPTTKKHILDSHSAKKSYRTISKPTTHIKSYLYALF